MDENISGPRPGMTQQGIAAVIITLNEEANLNRCLESVEGLVDEIIVLDSGSKDATVKIAQSWGAQVWEVAWQGYATTKNQGHRRASYSYILSLDADEALSPALRKAIYAAKEEGLTGAYRINRLNHYCGRWIRYGGFYPDTKIRLFPKDEVYWQEKAVHEILYCPSSLRIQELNGDLLHYSYYSRREHQERLRRYAWLAAQQYQSRKGLFWKMWLSPAWRFLQIYILRGGFLDGKAGWHLCRGTALEVHLKYRWAYELQRGKKVENQPE